MQQPYSGIKHKTHRSTRISARPRQITNQTPPLNFCFPFLHLFSISIPNCRQNLETGKIDCKGLPNRTLPFESLTHTYTLRQKQHSFLHQAKIEIKKQQIERFDSLEVPNDQTQKYIQTYKPDPNI